MRLSLGVASDPPSKYKWPLLLPGPGHSCSLFWFLFETQCSEFFPLNKRTPQGQTQSSHWWVDVKVNDNIFVHHWVLGCIQHAYSYMCQDCSPSSLVFWELLLRKVEAGPSQRVVSSVAMGSGEAWPCGQRLWAVGRPWPWSCAQIWYLPYETIIRDWWMEKLPEWGWGGKQEKHLRYHEGCLAQWDIFPPTDTEAEPL